MKGKERRKEIAALIMSEQEPLSGTVLSERLGVSRQIIVQDIAMLRTEGYDILSTHQGYVITKGPFAERVFKLRHTSEQTEEELRCIVALGGTVVNVFVWHKVYGKIEAGMNLFSERGIAQFMDGIKSGKSKELMHITEGYHYHTVRADSEETLDAIEKALDAKGYIVPEI
ncbi:MAG: transcription repressor NadR [Lachnospiraceae bacterium]|nr:transcription repressor NadR [Lachnospiraceae bacterium]